MPYFPYIDGLRAIAVLAIVVYHFQRGALPGGFLGVDIFIGPLRASGSSICVVLDVPDFPDLVPYATAMARRRGLDTSFLDVTRTQILARDSYFEGPAPALEVTRGVKVVDPKDVLCAGERCAFESSDGRSLYRDADHLSPVGAMLVARSLEPCLQSLPGRIALLCDKA